MSDGSPLDNLVFTLINFESLTTAPKGLSVYTTDYSKVGTYDLKTTLAYINLPDVKVETEWQFEVKLCDGTIDADVMIWQDAAYYITDTALTLSWTP